MIEKSLVKENLVKLNFVKKNNQIVNLKNKLTSKDKKIEKMANSCKEILSDYQNKTEKELNSMQDKLNYLENENKELKKQKEFYKNILDKIPSFIIKVFAGKNALLEKGKKDYE